MEMAIEAPVKEETSDLKKQLSELEETNDDDDWATSLQNLEKNYDIFYSEQVTNINVYFFYENKGELEKIRQENIDISDNTISKDQLIYIINDNKYILNTKYYLSSILKYNVSLEPGKIYDFLTDEDVGEYKYLHKLKTITDVSFSDTISMFNDFNSLYVVFSKSKPVRNQTKKVNFNRGRMTKKRI